MKRDVDMVRNILLEFEAEPDWLFSVSEEIGQEPDAKEYHYELMVDAGLLTKTSHKSAIYRMTWQGHDFLDSVRDPEIWRRTSEGADAAKGFTFDILRDLAKGFLKTKIKEHTGIDL